MSKKQIAWAMVDQNGYIYPHYIRCLKKEVIQALDEHGTGWKFLNSIGRTIIKIELEKL